MRYCMVSFVFPNFPLFTLVETIDYREDKLDKAGFTICSQFVASELLHCLCNRQQPCCPLNTIITV
jgi:hypothetical protein